MSGPLALNILDPASLASTFGLAGLTVIVFAETGLLLGFFLPGDSLLFLAGAYSTTRTTAGQPHFHIGSVLAGVAVAALVGAQTGYLLGRRAGPVLFNRPDSRLFKQENVERTQEFLDRYGYGKAIILARFVPVIRTFMNPVAGVVGVPARAFTLFNVAGGLIWSLGVTLLGYTLGRSISIDRYIIPITLLIVVVSAVPVVREYRRQTRPGRRPDARAGSDHDRLPR
ncbi:MULTISPECIES: DedA family protein [unclassified Frankia]|uniref:DedA family protein n=1 Tax=unclassified Frankia TaxID=2632575 RepID=UPI0040450349